jgi:hypothetical protein
VGVMKEVVDVVEEEVEAESETEGNGKNPSDQ